MLRLIKTIAITAAALAVIVLTLRVMFPLPELEAAGPRDRRPAPGDTDLGQMVLPLIEAHPDTSGVMLLDSGTDAFAARVLLTRSATATIDAQYYIWQDDLTGLRLLAELQEAAHRGVRVRLLVDDNGTTALDQELVALDALPSAEVRIFNPFVLRSARALNYAFDFSRLNRRMHNKSFTFDNVVTIVGGRNIGDVYFETGAGHTYLDLDVLAAGPIAVEVGDDFERYWDSASAFPAQSLILQEPGAETRLEERDAANRETAQGMLYSEAVRTSSLITQLRDKALPIEWVPTQLFSDDPSKVQGLVEKEELMVRHLMDEVGTPALSYDIISAYLVAGDMTTDQLTEFAADGVQVRLLTNSLEATDVVVVHAGYVNYRTELVRGGVKVFELRSDGADRRTVNELGSLTLSKAALHAKSFSVDRRRAFIGSLNFDPRSRRLNTEMGLLIDSRRIAGRISDWLDTNLPTHAYAVSADDTGAMVWTAREDDGGVTSFETEPNTTMPLRILVGFISLLPIQWML